MTILDFGQTIFSLIVQIMQKQMFIVYLKVS